MQFSIEVTEEHEDGSATCKLDIDKEALEALVERGVIALLTDYIKSKEATQSPTWPFPPPGGPVPWTEEQKKAYEQQQRNQEEPAKW